MRKIFSALLFSLILSVPFISAATQPSTADNLIATDPDTWTAADTRVSFTLPASSPARPVASFLDAGALAETTDTADVTIAPGRLEMPQSRLMSVTVNEVPPMMTNPTRPMALEGPLAIPEPGSWVLFASGMLALPFLLRRKRTA